MPAIETPDGEGLEDGDKGTEAQEQGGWLAELQALSARAGSRKPDPLETRFGEAGSICRDIGSRASALPGSAETQLDGNWFPRARGVAASRATSGKGPRENGGRRRGPVRKSWVSFSQMGGPAGNGGPEVIRRGAAKAVGVASGAAPVGVQALNISDEAEEAMLPIHVLAARELGADPEDTLTLDSFEKRAVWTLEVMRDVLENFGDGSVPVLPNAETIQTMRQMGIYDIYLKRYVEAVEAYFQREFGNAAGTKAVEILPEALKPGFFDKVSPVEARAGEKETEEIFLNLLELRAEAEQGFESTIKAMEWQAQTLNGFITRLGLRIDPIDGVADIRRMNRTGTWRTYVSMLKNMVVASFVERGADSAQIGRMLPLCFDEHFLRMAKISSRG